MDLMMIHAIEDTSYLDSYIFQPANLDIAELTRANFLDFGRANTNRGGRYQFIMGTCLGYPMDLVMSFCRSHVTEEPLWNEFCWLASLV